MKLFIELMTLFDGITKMWILNCIEVLIVLLAMFVDFISGCQKSKIRGISTNSDDMKRTVSKFILYIGSLSIACCIDSIFYICDFWIITHVPVLKFIPVVSSVAAVFLCTVEGISIWEKAEVKQKRDAKKTAQALGELIKNKSVMDALKALEEEKNEKESV